MAGLERAHPPPCNTPVKKPSTWVSRPQPKVASPKHTTDKQSTYFPVKKHEQANKIKSQAHVVHEHQGPSVEAQRATTQSTAPPVRRGLSAAAQRALAANFGANMNSGLAIGLTVNAVVPIACTPVVPEAKSASVNMGSSNKKDFDSDSDSSEADIPIGDRINARRSNTPPPKVGPPESSMKTETQKEVDMTPDDSSVKGLSSQRRPFASAEIRPGVPVKMKLYGISFGSDQEVDPLLLISTPDTGNKRCSNLAELSVPSGPDKRVHVSSTSTGYR